MRQGVAVNAANNHITFNVIDQNGSPGENIEETTAGVLLIGSPGPADSNVIAFNAISGNGPNGVVLSVSHKNIVASNVITQTSVSPERRGAGVNVFTGSTDNFFVGNIALDNKPDDLVDNNKSCDHNKWKDNIFRTSSPSGPNTCIH